MTLDLVQDLKSYWKLSNRQFRGWMTAKRSLLITVFAVLVSVAGYTTAPFGTTLINNLNSVVFGMVAVQYARITVKLYQKPD